ncbi:MULTISPECIES: transposase [Bacteria]|uniref:transposase n=1 Tax=Bacteria TaxID=2 RepID=UPI002A760051|nr:MULTISPECIES: transposase [Bacteria]MDY2734631.1 transposase [Intestinibacter sp.]MDY4067215.1 transposase [Bullifex sp.]
MGRNKKTYTDEFKLKCIKELLDGKAFSEVCSSNNVAPSTLSDWKKAILLNGFGNKEAKRFQKLHEEAEEKLAAAKAIIGQKELEIDLLKKDQRF